MHSRDTRLARDTAWFRKRTLRYARAYSNQHLRDMMYRRREAVVRRHVINTQRVAIVPRTIQDVVECRAWGTDFVRPVTF
jgi:hypothetical protein